MEKKDVNTLVVESLAPQVRGQVTLPADPGYEDSRKVYNAMIDRRPSAIIDCMDAADVIATVNLARDNGLRLAVRGGGHNGAGLGVADDAIVADISQLRGVRVDPKNRTARVGGGTLLGEMDHATHAFGLAVTAGIISTTGVGGLTLGGGLGYLSRKCGLTIDNLIEADVVLADGTQVTAGEKENPELFWAIRGGGGNFGVVTSFLFNLHPISTVYGGPMAWLVEDSEEIGAKYRELMAEHENDDDFYGFFMIQSMPPVDVFPEAVRGKKVCGVQFCHTGGEKAAKEALAPLRELKTPALDWVGPMPYPALQSMFDPFYPAGLQWYWKTHHLDSLSDAALAVQAEYGRKAPTLLSAMHLYPVDGAASRVGADETAWSHRDAKWVMVIPGIDPEPKNAGAIRDWSRGYWEAMKPHARGGGYVNFLMDEGIDPIKATYRDNYDRLVAAKRKFDPQNLFSVNQNIAP